MQAARPQPLVLIMGMMNTREPADFLAPFAGMAQQVLALTIPGRAQRASGRDIADAGRGRLGLAAAVQSTVDPQAPLPQLPRRPACVICGSLYLAG